MVTKTKPPTDGEVPLTANTFAELSGRVEMSENRLRTGQNRFLLYRSYTEDAEVDFFKKAERKEDECNIGIEL